MIKIENIYLSYTKEYFTLNDINLTIKDHEHVVLLGEKESGKSSLLRLLVGIEKPTKGEIFFNDTPIKRVDFKNQIKLGYLSTSGAFLLNKTVYQNLEYVLKVRGMSKEEVKQKVNTAILLNKLENISQIKVKLLSHFDKLRVALARLSLRKLDYLVVDDVFETVSPKEAIGLMESVNDILNKNSACTFIVAVNDAKIAENFKNAKVVKLKFGSIVE